MPRQRYVARTGRSDGAVRDRRSYTQFGTRPVELVTSDPRGDLIEGHLRVPLRLVGTKQHTNERIEFTEYLQTNIKRWVEWREHKGWRLNSQPKVSGPYDPLVETEQSELPDWKLYIVRAHFKPEHAIIAGFTDIYEIERRAQLYGIDLWAPKPTVTPMPKAKAVIYDDQPMDDPMVVAEERRKALGVSRSDYLIGDISEPLSPIDLTK